MHLLMILVALGLTWFLRLGWSGADGSWTERWTRARYLFLFPPLLLMMTGVAVLCMGPQGRMVGLSAGWFSYLLAISFLGLVGGKCLHLGWQGWRSQRQIGTYSLLVVRDMPGRILDTSVPFAALVGFLQPELVVSRGLLNSLTSAHLDAVIAHEQAHYYYRDTFWFFWLGWMRSCTAWLPHTDALWEELLSLREIRADSWAVQQVDPLVLAESLLMVVSATSSIPITGFYAAFSEVTQRNRLEERIEALLAEAPSSVPQIDWQSWTWFLLAFLPLVAIPFHT